MASATKEHPLWEEAVAEARREVAELSEPHRVAVSADIEAIISNPRLMMSEKDLDSVAAQAELLANVPLTFDQLADCDAGTPMTWTEVGQEIRTLALELRALKQEGDRFKRLEREVAHLQHTLRAMGEFFIAAPPDPGEGRARDGAQS